MKSHIIFKISMIFLILLMPLVFADINLGDINNTIEEDYVNLMVKPLELDNYLINGVTTIIKANIVNIGSNDADQVIIKFYVDKNLEDTFIVDELPSGQDLAVAFDWVPDEGMHLLQIMVDSSNKESDIEDNIANKHVKVENIIPVNIDNLDGTLSMPPYFALDEISEFEVQSHITNYGKEDIRNLPVDLYIDGGINMKGPARKTLFSLKAGESKVLTWTLTTGTKYTRPGNVIILKIADKPVSNKKITYDGEHGFV